jgi:N-acyl homoserine lactone hydrolase
MKHGNEWLLWDAGVRASAHKDPRGWSTLPKLNVYHLDRTPTDQLAEIGLNPRDITLAISHAHGDHLGDVTMFANATIYKTQEDKLKLLPAFCD